MPYRPKLLFKVPVPDLVDEGEEPPIFWFGATDKSFPRVLMAVQALAHSGIDIENLDVNAVPPQLAGILCELVIEGVRRWEGVENEDGGPLDCTPEAVAELPTVDKIIIGGTYLVAWGELEEKKSALNSPPTSSTAPEPSTEACASPTNGP